MVCLLGDVVAVLAYTHYSLYTHARSVFNGTDTITCCVSSCFHPFQSQILNTLHILTHIVNLLPFNLLSLRYFRLVSIPPSGLDLEGGIQASGVITAIVFVLLLFGGGGAWYWKKGRYMDALGGRQRRLWRDNKVRQRERERERDVLSCLHPLCTRVLLCVMCV